MFGGGTPTRFSGPGASTRPGRCSPRSGSRERSRPDRGGLQAPSGRPSGLPDPPAIIARLPEPASASSPRSGVYSSVEGAPDSGAPEWNEGEVQVTLARESLITQEGLEKLREELEYMTTVKRREVAERIKDAREFGDIMENAEYDDAKNEQALLEQRIAHLEERIRRATVVDEKHVNTDVVSVGVRVSVKDQKSGDSKKFQIVRSAEADPPEDKLSTAPPIGSALAGHKHGDVVSVEVPRGPKRRLKITKIEAAQKYSRPQEP